MTYKIPPERLDYFLNFRKEKHIEWLCVPDGQEARELERLGYGEYHGANRDGDNGVF